MLILVLAMGRGGQGGQGGLLDEPDLLDYRFAVVDMTMLEILSENRDLQAQVREAERMLTRVDVRRLPS